MSNFTITIKDENNPNAPVITYSGVKSIEAIKAYIEQVENNETESKDLPPCKPTNQAFYNYDKNPELSHCEPCQEQGFDYAKK
ncbi:Uncharacterised protein [Phocoenobacter uteri]|uniref:Uncharacterized protein n=1 Tax=Phocoenobacter uteri TaxID=146806 RepID=A0A379CBR1_9PAST|nr:hypothetical protein [Phocoenobacter uteri]MDG6881549.1 hypothetical protein [Phocoenobacter uteri]SUB59579.1 Uncharacterised protein [Phocoenobacter uteri]